MNLKKFVSKMRSVKLGRILPILNLLYYAIILLTHNYYEPTSQLLTPKQFDLILFTCFCLMLVINYFIYLKEGSSFWETINFNCYLAINVCLLIYLIFYPRFFPFLPV